MIKKVTKSQDGLIGTPSQITWRSSVKIGLPAYSSVEMSFQMTVDLNDEDNYERAIWQLKEKVAETTEEAIQKEVAHWKEVLD